MISRTELLERYGGYIPAGLGVVSLALLLAAYFPLMQSGPAEAHSMLLIEHGARTPWWRFWDTPLAEGPRFVMYASFALQHAVSGLRAFDYYLVNVLLLWLSGIFVALFSYRLTANLAVSTLAPLIYWLYGSLYNTIEWLPARQEPMVIIFGLGALLFVMRPNARIGLLGAAVVLLLLGLSVFSKEYGLVFVAGVGWYVLIWRRDLLVPVWSACALVAVLLLYARLASAVGIYQDALQCEDMGYFWEMKRTCTTTDLTDSQNVAQLTWNAALGLLAQIVPPTPGHHSFFLTPYTDWGTIRIDQIRKFDWIVSAGFAAMFVIAFVKRMPFLSLAVIMILANTLLSAPFFRTRNVVFGFVSTTVILAFGAMVVVSFLSTLPVRRFVERISQPNNLPFVGRVSWIRRNLPIKRLWSPDANVASWLAIGFFFVVVFAPQMAIIHSLGAYEKYRKSTPDYVCPQTAMVINRDLGGGKAVHSDIIEQILKENGVAYESCGIFS